MVKRNLVTNLAGRGAAVLFQAVTVPLYLHLLGVEAVGLIGFYTAMVTALGAAGDAIGTLVMREMAVLSEDPNGAQFQRNLLRTAEALYVILSTIIGVSVTLTSPAIVRIWLSKSSVADSTLIQCVQLMGWTVALQLFGSIYISVLNGLERQLQSNALALTLVVLRGVSAIFTLLVISTTVEAYFISQLLVTMVVLLLASLVAWRHLPRAPFPGFPSFEILVTVWRQSRSLAGAAVLFVILSQVDKLVASGLLPLKEFGYYVLANMIASLMFSVYGAIGTALVPRFARLITSHSNKQLKQLFHLTSQLICFLLVPAAALIMFFGEELVFLWTNSFDTASNVAPLATLLATGVLLVCLACASNSVQLAAGFYELNLLNNLCWIIAIPLTVVAVNKCGAAGATVMWLVAGVINLSLAPSFLHRRMLKKEQLRWYLFDLAIPTSAGISACAVASVFLTPVPSQLLNCLRLGAVWIVCSLIVLSLCPDLRRVAINTLRSSIVNRPRRNSRTKAGSSRN